MSAYEKTDDVDRDIEAIVTYTFERWGPGQVRKYISGLEQMLSDLAEGKALYKARDDLGEGMIT